MSGLSQREKVSAALHVTNWALAISSPAPITTPTPSTNSKVDSFLMSFLRLPEATHVVSATHGIAITRYDGDAGQKGNARGQDAGGGGVLLRLGRTVKSSARAS